MTSSLLLIGIAVACGALAWLAFARLPLPPFPLDVMDSPVGRGVPDRAVMTKEASRTPLETYEDSVVNAEAFKRETPEVWSHLLTRLSVLLVEDDDDSRGMLADMLARHCARVIAVSTATEALEMLQRHHVDVLLSDLRLPSMDGFALIHELRLQQDPALATMPAASITASRHIEDRHHALAAGYQVFLQKPVHPDILVTTMAALAAMPRAGRTTH